MANTRHCQTWIKKFHSMQCVRAQLCICNITWVLTIAVGARPRVVKMDATQREHAALARELGVRGYPTLVLVTPKDEVGTTFHSIPT